MHEFAIVQSLCEAALEEAKRHRAAGILSVTCRVGVLRQFALFLSDLVLIPSKVDHLSSLGVQDIIHELATAREIHGWEGGILGILPTFHDKITTQSRAQRDRLREEYGDLVLPPIHQATVLRECSARGKTIFDLDPQSRAAKEYATLVWRVLDA